MGTNAELTDVSQQIQLDHELVRETAAAIERELERLGDLAVGARRGDVLYGLLHPLREHLSKHFALEEAGGLLGSIEITTATAVRRAANLIAEHHGLLRQLGEVCDALRDSERDARGIPAALLCDARGWLTKLSDHEARETDLMLETLYQDHGCGD